MPILAIFFDLGDTLVTTTPRKFLPGAKELLADLKAQGFRLGIISNTGNLTTRAAVLAVLPADFDIAVFVPGLVQFSSEVGMEKPKPIIFRKAVSQSGIPAEQCLYCSENIVETLVAQHVGMRALRVKPPPGGDLATLVAQITDFHSRI